MPSESEAREVTADPGEDRREPRTVPAGLFVLAVVLAGVFAVAAVLAVASSSDSEGGGDEARTAAGDYAERFLALDHTDLDGWIAEMRSIGTSGFAESVGRRQAELQTLLAESAVSWQGSAVEVYLTDVGGGVASAVVLYDLRVTDPDGTRTIPDQYLRVDLVDTQEGWLVERILSITTDSAAALAGAGPTSSPSVPAEGSGG